MFRRPSRPAAGHWLTTLRPADVLRTVEVPLQTAKRRPGAEREKTNPAETNNTCPNAKFDIKPRYSCKFDQETDDKASAFRWVTVQTGGRGVSQQLRLAGRQFYAEIECSLAAPDVWHLQFPRCAARVIGPSSKRGCERESSLCYLGNGIRFLFLIFESNFSRDPTVNTLTSHGLRVINILHDMPPLDSIYIGSRYLSLFKAVCPGSLRRRAIRWQFVTKYPGNVRAEPALHR